MIFFFLAFLFPLLFIHLPIFLVAHDSISVSHCLGWSVHPSVGRSVTLCFFVYLSIFNVEKTERHTGTVTYKVACTRLMAIGQWRCSSSSHFFLPFFFSFFSTLFKFFIDSFFLDAPSHLYKRECPSVCPCVH